MSKNKKRIVLALILAGMVTAGGCAAAKAITLRPATGESLPVEKPGDCSSRSDADGSDEVGHMGVGRLFSARAERHAGSAKAEEAVTSLRIWSSEDEDLPDWWDPDGAELVWTAAEHEAHRPDGIAPGGIDWNLKSASLTGWDGRTMTPMELEVLTRVMPREFAGCSAECIAAGFDSIMARWSCGYWGRTLFDVLSAVEDNGKYAYTTFPRIWEGEIEEYDWFRAYCLERFGAGPEWPEEAKYFQLYGYPDYNVPLYELDGVYFSASPWLEGWK